MDRSMITGFTCGLCSNCANDYHDHHDGGIYCTVEGCPCELEGVSG
jgi:hypothetical protein